MDAIQFYKYGPPEVLVFEEVDKPIILQGEIFIKVSKAGVNFSDIYQRKGINLASYLPYILGQEGTGTVVQSMCEKFKVGDRVAWLYSSGSYAEYVKILQERVVHIPEDIDENIIAASLLQA